MEYINSYYHTLTMPSWNWWYLVAPLFLVLAAILGRKYYHVVRTRRGLKIRARYNKTSKKLILAILALIVAIMIDNESGHWIVQWLDNGLGPNESAAWSVIIAPFVVVGVGWIYWGALLAVFDWQAGKQRSHLERHLRSRQQARQSEKQSANRTSQKTPQPRSSQSHSRLTRPSHQSQSSEQANVIQFPSRPHHARREDHDDTSHRFTVYDNPDYALRR